jgi:hypothetical protein
LSCDDQQSALLLSLNNATVVGVEHVQLSLRQSVGITFKLLLQRKDDVDEVDDVLIAHEGLNDRCSPSLSQSDWKQKKTKLSKQSKNP